MADDRDFFDSAASQAQVAIRTEVARHRPAPIWHTALFIALGLVGFACLIIAYFDAFGVL